MRSTTILAVVLMAAGLTGCLATDGITQASTADRCQHGDRHKTSSGTVAPGQPLLVEARTDGDDAEGAITVSGSAAGEFTGTIAHEGDEVDRIALSGAATDISFSARRKADRRATTRSR